MQLTLGSHSEQITKQIGKKLAQRCAVYSSFIIYLYGELGTGKTTLSRGFINYFGKHIVKSPTYSIVESYELDTHTIHHFDLYRISDPEELDYIGIREYNSALCLFEWPQLGKDNIPLADLHITLNDDTPKILNLQAITENGEKVLYGW